MHCKYENIMFFYYKECLQKYFFLLLYITFDVFLQEEYCVHPWIYTDSPFPLISKKRCHHSDLNSGWRVSSNGMKCALIRVDNRFIKLDQKSKSQKSMLHILAFLGHDCYFIILPESFLGVPLIGLWTIRHDNIGPRSVSSWQLANFCHDDTINHELSEEGHERCAHYFKVKVWGSR